MEDSTAVAGREHLVFRDRTPMRVAGVHDHTVLQERTGRDRAGPTKAGVDGHNARGRGVFAPRPPRVLSYGLSY